VAAPVVLSKRLALKTLARDVLHGVSEARKCLREAEALADFFASPDTCHALTRAYPRELFEPEAKRLGLDIDKLGIDRAVELIFEANAQSGPGGRRA